MLDFNFSREHTSMTPQLYAEILIKVMVCRSYIEVKISTQSHYNYSLYSSLAISRQYSRVVYDVVVKVMTIFSIGQQVVCL